MERSMSLSEPVQGIKDIEDTTAGHGKTATFEAELKIFVPEIEVNW